MVSILNPAQVSRGESHNQFDGISKSSIQQTTHCFTQLQRDLFGRKRKDGGEGDDGEKIDSEDGGGIPAQLAGNNANGNHNQEEIDIACDEESVACDQVCFQVERKHTAKKCHLGDMP